MSWHTNAILIRADFSDNYPALLAALGLPEVSRAGPISFDDATSSASEGVAVGYADGWTVLWGNRALLIMIDEAGLARLARTADVFQMTLEGSSGTAGFTWHAGGEKVRDWLRVADEVLKDEGQPLAVEAAAFSDQDDQQALFGILQLLTLRYSTFAAIEYEMYEYPDDAF
jgi:hypothetical protein